MADAAPWRMITLEEMMMNSDVSEMLRTRVKELDEYWERCNRVMLAMQVAKAHARHRRPWHPRWRSW